MWFQEVFGFQEMNGADGYKATQKTFRYDPETGALFSGDNGDKKFAAGVFTTPSLQELRKRNNLEEAITMGGQQLTVVEVLGDVSEIHGRPENNYAVFQAASQFNTLEHTSQHGAPEHGITGYSGDKTQGPACAVACAPGTIVRNYFAFYPEGQTQDRQVQNLDGVERLLNNADEDYFKVQAGYTMAGRNLSKLPAKLKGNEQLQEAIRQELKIGVQEDTQVVCSRFGAVMHTGPQQLVTQCYCSALSISYAGTGPRYWEHLAILVLESLYEATMYVALENWKRHPKEPGARKVFLTAVGGGVFGNDMRWIVQAMEKALIKFRDVGLEVYLVSFGQSTREFADLVDAWQGGKGRGDGCLIA